LTLEEAVESYRQARSEVIWDENMGIMIDQILLEYLVGCHDSKYILHPVWSFYFKQTDDEFPGTMMGEYYRIDRIDAYTGEAVRVYTY